MVLSLSAKGLTHGEISAHLEEIYEAKVSKETVTRITDSVTRDDGGVAEPASRGGAVSGGRCESGCVVGFGEVLHSLFGCAVPEHESWPLVELSGDAVEVFSVVDG